MQNTDTRSEAQPINVEAAAARKLSDAADSLRIWSMAGERFDDDTEPRRRAVVEAMATMADELGLAGIAVDLSHAAESAFGEAGPS